MARRPQAVESSEFAPTPDEAGENGLPAGVEVFISSSGATLYQAPDGSVFSDLTELTTYLSQNQVEIVINQFMAAVEADPHRFFSDKKGDIPGGRALLASQTRLRNNATSFFSWYLSQMLEETIN